MKNPDWYRALFDEERNAYVVWDYGTVNGEPVVEYRFVALEDDEDDGLEGALEKFYLDEEGYSAGEVVAFGLYADEAAFEAAVADLRREAEERAQAENLDAFLAIVDLVKEWAVEAELLEEGVFDWEGLFELGPEDAYTLRAADFETRLHDHVERSADECWRLHAARAIDPAGEALGWVMLVLHYPELTSAADDEQVAGAEYARVLDVDHCVNEFDARYATQAFYGYMERERLEDPELAYTDDTMIFELVAEGKKPEPALVTEWRELRGNELAALLKGGAPFVIEREQWYPSEDSITRYARSAELSPHVEDQLRSMLMDQYGVHEPLDVNSPWNQVDLDL